MTASKIGLASSVFSGAGTDELLAQDVYEVNEGSDKTSFISKLDNLGYTAAAYIRDEPESVRDLLYLAKDMRQNTGLSPLQSLARIKNMMPNGVLANISKLGGKGTSVIEGLAAKVGVSPELVGKVKVIAGEVAGTVMDSAMYGDINKFEVMRSLLNDTSMFRYLNIEEEVLLANRVFMAAAGQDIFSTMLDQWELKYDKDVYKWALSYAVPQIVYTGDLESMKAVIAKIGIAAFMAQAPNAIQDVLTSYKMPYGTKVTQYPALFNDLIRTLRLVDPAFPKIASTVVVSEDTPARVGVINLGVCQNLSADAKMLFLLADDVDFQIMALHGQNYPLTTKEALFNEFYPEAAIGQTE